MKNQEYQTRKERSLDMLKRGIEPIKDGYNEYQIPSQNDNNKKYKVTIKDGWYTCQCPDNSLKHLCKHILLLKTYLAMKLQAKEFKSNITISKLCPYCNSEKAVKDGTRKTTTGKKQRWLCKQCNGRFVADSIKKSKANIDTVCLVMDLYFKGNSLRDIADTLKQSYGLNIHHESVRRWINTYMQKIREHTNQLSPKVSGVWNADEQKVKLKKKDGWVWSWNVMDSETKFLIANQISKEREIRDARRIFRKAKANAGRKDVRIITDGLQSYRQAIKKEFMTYNNKKPHVRLRTIRDKPNNNLIERYHGTFRERDKVMRGFQNTKTASNYNENFRTYYNFIKKHQGLKGMTPAQKANINETSEWKPLLLKSLQSTQIRAKEMEK